VTVPTNAADQRFPALPDVGADDGPAHLERLVLGKLLTMPNAGECLNQVTLDDFAVPGHKHIFAAISAHTEKSVDNAKVIEDLINVRSVQAFGDTVLYLSRLRNEGIDAVGTFGFHAGRMRQAGQLRAIRDAAEAAYRAAEQGDHAAAVAALTSVIPSDDEGVERGNPMSSWRPVDITAVLDGTRVQPVPEIGRRQDGVRMFYRGKEHSVASEPECGKTWWLLLQVVDVLIEGGRVVYVDFEDDENTIVGRLLMLGCLPTHLSPATFRYVRPESKPTPAALRALITFEPEVFADLVVYDGVTEGMSLLGIEINDQESAAEWRRIFVKPALRKGAATVSTDHVVKNKDARGRFAIGAQHKLAGLTGVMFLMESVKPFGDGIKGSSRVLISKDRNGGLRKHGRVLESGLTHIGDLVGDAISEGSPSWRFFAPHEERTVEELADEGSEPGRPPADIRGAVDSVAKYLADHPGSSGRVVRANVGGRTTSVTAALDWLASNGHAVETVGDRRAVLYTLVDQLEEVAA
jgi:hypothetical protein